ncbi:hypothetical protein D1BOALGB6SA_8342 [Olavius sp. associated proteobacterium Delta 1]|nr:hypothetical protein D1BOALGB6SA_8342 [Olavius sp. associated proteobacterium Delta 1]
MKYHKVTNKICSLNVNCNFDQYVSLYDQLFLRTKSLLELHQKRHNFIYIDFGQSQYLSMQLFWTISK